MPYQSGNDEDEIEKCQLFGKPDQWGRSYPSRELMEDDIRNDCSYVIEDETSLRAVFVMIEAPEPTYSVIDGE